MAFACTRNGKVINLKTGNFLSGAINKDGYKFTTISFGTRKATFSFHQMVWVFFNNEVPNKMQINHINGNKIDNRLANLEICTAKENMAHADKMGLRADFRGESSVFAKLNEKQVIQIRKLSSSGASQREIAKTFAIAQTTVSSIVKRKIWKHIC